MGPVTPSLFASAPPARVCNYLFAHLFTVCPPQTAARAGASVSFTTKPPPRPASRAGGLHETWRYWGVRGEGSHTRPVPTLLNRPKQLGPEIPWKQAKEESCDQGPSQEVPEPQSSVALQASEKEEAVSPPSLLRPQQLPLSQN